jgi:hypothetical protein
MSNTLSTTTIGVLGGKWRADVDRRGRVTPWGGTPLDWWVAAEDRWHDPQTESTVRQRNVEGAPVVETRVRVPGGDVVHRVYAVADAGGLTIIEIENESSASIAIVFSHGHLLTARPPANVPIEGIEVPATAVSFPVGHHALLRVAIAHTRSTNTLPGELPAAAAVVRGWTRRCEAASRLLLPETALVDQLVASRCALMLDGPVDPKVDAAATAVGLAELVRMGADAVDLVPEAVTAAERLARAARTCGLSWEASVALGATERLMAAADDTRAAADVAAVRARLGGDGAPAPVSAPTGILYVPWLEQRFARPVPGARCQLLAQGWPREWLGANLEVHGLPAGPRSTIGYALRWHGDRPAVLWQVDGDPVGLFGGVDAAEWSTESMSGEALWPAPR